MKIPNSPPQTIVNVNHHQNSMTMSMTMQRSPQKVNRSKTLVSLVTNFSVQFAKFQIQHKSQEIENGSTLTNSTYLTGLFTEA